MLLASQHTPNSPAGIRYVALVARDEMDVDMHARLAARFANIDPNVKSVWPVLCIAGFMRLIEQIEDRRLLLGSHMEKIGDMSLWYDEDVPATERIVVVSYVGKRILDYHVAQGT